MSMAEWSLNQKFWNQLTILRLKNTLPEVCLELLRSCPKNLEIFECVDPADTLFDDFSPSPIIPRHLTNFEWTGTFGEFEEHFWHCVRLPAVRNLKWNILSSVNMPFFASRHRFFNSLEQLEVLTIEQYRDIDVLREVWLYFDSLQELLLNACQLQKQSVDIMDVLTLRNNPRRNLLPNLKVLSIEILIGSGRSIAQMLRSRCGGAHQGEVHDEACQMIRISLEKAVLRMEELICEGGDGEDLNNLIDGGLELYIYVGGDFVNHF